jgi:hypothetical protein
LKKLLAILLIIVVMSACANSITEFTDTSKLCDDLKEAIEKDGVTNKDLFMFSIMLNWNTIAEETDRIVTEEHGLDAENYRNIVDTEWFECPETGEQDSIRTLKNGEVISQKQLDEFYDIWESVHTPLWNEAFNNFIEEHVDPDSIKTLQIEHSYLVVEGTIAELKRFSELDEVFELRMKYPASVGTVNVISNQTEYEPLENWHHGENDEHSASGISIPIEKIADGSYLNDENYYNEGAELPIIHYADDFEIVLNEVPHGDGKVSGITLYNIETEEEHSFGNINSFEMPKESGEYILCVWANWSSNVVTSWNAYQYFFKIIVD